MYTTCLCQGGRDLGEGQLQMDLMKSSVSLIVHWQGCVGHYGTSGTMAINYSIIKFISNPWFQESDFEGKY